MSRNVDACMPKKAPIGPVNTLGGRIQMRMRVMGISGPAELALLLSKELQRTVHRQKVYKWIHVAKYFEFDALFALAVVLDCNVRWLAIADGPETSRKTKGLTTA